jgi:hypothetical protein
MSCSSRRLPVTFYPSQEIVLAAVQARMPPGTGPGASTSAAVRRCVDLVGVLHQLPPAVLLRLENAADGRLDPSEVLSE